MKTMGDYNKQVYPMEEPGFIFISRQMALK